MAPYAPPSTPGHVKVLLQKIEDADPDIRYMALNDLFTILKNASALFMSSDQKTEEETIEKILKKLDDQNGDVQNQAIRWYVPLGHSLVMRKTHFDFQPKYASP